MLEHMDEQKLNEFLEQDRVVVECFTPQCAHCKNIQQMLEQSAAKWKEKVKFGIVDVTESLLFAQKFQVISVPTLLFFKKGELKQKVVGETYPEVIDQMIHRL